MFPVPFRASQRSVDPTWIDYNGHLNMAYYNVLFDSALDEAGLLVGLGPDYVASGFTWFTLEAHVRYLRELRAGERVHVDIRLVDMDSKRLHWWEEMWSDDGAFLAATSESLTLHVDLTAKKAAPLPPAMADAASAWRAQDAAHTRPEGLGRSVGIRRG
jgi:acyl-CoA thioester hydrolase